MNCMGVIWPVTSGAASCWETVVALALNSASNHSTGFFAVASVCTTSCRRRREVASACGATLNPVTCSLVLQRLVAVVLRQVLQPAFGRRR